MINCDPHYVNERQSDLRAVKRAGTRWTSTASFYSAHFLTERVV
jgi:hypothetical protein